MSRSAPVMNGLTQKQELFAALVSEGLNFSAAYRKAYDAEGMAAPSVWREAHHLSRQQNVAKRITLLVNEKIEEERLQASMRAYKVTAHLEDLMTKGKSESTRLRAAELLGKTVGLFVDRTEICETGHRTTAELEAELVERLGCLKTISTEEGNPKD